jgi:dCMP deaminase
LKQSIIEAHMDVAERYARLSSARRLKVGAIVVQDDRVISIGYNGTAPGADNNCELEPLNWDGDIRKLRTLPDVIHAEDNALRKLEVENTLGDGVNWHGAAYADMFCNFACCLPCAEKIAKAGVKTFYYRYAYRDTNGIDFLEANGVEVKQVV